MVKGPGTVLPSCHTVGYITQSQAHQHENRFTIAEVAADDRYSQYTVHRKGCGELLQLLLLLLEYPTRH